ncbi:hypothetical protein PIB30_034675 [Stylosanthes scabra]|uniref:Uncharacterized protein n=1 Tax=Stylosanthes scabra TaxID=79078 RepID=A0ABU6RD02_9FABA|nr:hypothetical protein [Stylosanthes scabra]
MNVEQPPSSQDPTLWGSAHGPLVFAPTPKELTYVRKARKKPTLDMLLEQLQWRTLHNKKRQPAEVIDALVRNQEAFKKAHLHDVRLNLQQSQSSPPSALSSSRWESPSNNLWKVNVHATTGSNELVRMGVVIQD